MAEVNEIEVCSEASELRSYIQTVDQQIKEVENKILNDIDHEDQSSAISQIEKLQNDQQLIKTDFGELLRTFFSVSLSLLLSPENVLELLPKLKKEKERIDSLKTEMEKLKKEEEGLNERLKVFFTQLGLSEAESPESKDLTSTSGAGDHHNQGQDDHFKDKNSVPTNISEESSKSTSVSDQSNDSTRDDQDNDADLEDNGFSDTSTSETTNLEESGESKNLSPQELSPDQSTHSTSGKTDDDHRSQGSDDLKDKNTIPTDGSSAQNIDASEPNLEQKRESTNVSPGETSQDQSTDTTSGRADDQGSVHDLKGNNSVPADEIISSRTSKTGSSETNLQVSQTSEISHGQSEDPKSDGVDGLEHKGHVQTGESSSSGTNVESYSKLLSKKLILINHYFLSNSWNKEYSLLLSVNNSSLRVKTMAELVEKIQRLIHREKRNEMAKARSEGKKSLMDWLAGVSEVEKLMNPHYYAIKASVNKVGISLSHHLSNFLFVVSENSEVYDKFKYLKFILILLMENGKSKVIKRIVHAIKDLEMDLIIDRKLKIHEIKERNFEQVDKEIRDGDDCETEIDHIFNVFLKEVLCLESMLNYPILSKEGRLLNKELRDFSNDLVKYKKRIDEIGSKVIYLTALHKFIFEIRQEATMMEEHRRMMSRVIAYQWGRVENPENY